MKILLVADLHYSLKQWDWVGEVAGKFDLVVIAGDMLDLVSVVEKDVQVLVVLKYLRRMAPKVPIIMSSGNHDLTSNGESGEQAAPWLRRAREFGVIVDGESLEKDGTWFTVCPWWDGEFTRAAIGEQLARDAEIARDKDQWIWVYHSPPVDTKVSWDGKHDYGDKALRAWVEQYQPDLVLGGHIHHAPFAKDGGWSDRIGKTWLFNSGHQIGPVPAFTVIDTEAHRAEWISQAGHESEQLA